MSTEKLKYNREKIFYKKLKNLECKLDWTYDWIKLRDSLEKHGIKAPLILSQGDNIVNDQGNKMHGVMDGNHRLAIAKLIYGPEYEVACIKDEHTDFWRKSYKPNHPRSKYHIPLRDYLAIT